MRRLYVQVYLTIVVALLAVVLVAGAMWRRGAQAVPTRQAFEIAGEMAAVALAPPEAGAEEQRRAVENLAHRLKLDLALFTEDRVPIASAGRPLPPPPHYREESGWMYGRGGPMWAIELPDGRWLVATARRHHVHPGLGLIAFLGTIALLVAVSAFPLVRGLTRRIERLQAGVEQLGRGDLKARVEVEGRDEVALLAASFNRAAARIEQLVGAHKMLLANASHELRTPLSRIRLGLELMDQQPQDAARKAALAKDIAELDELIGEILLASRLDAVTELETKEEVDLLALAAEEAARYRD